MKRSVLLVGVAQPRFVLAGSDCYPLSKGMIMSRMLKIGFLVVGCATLAVVATHEVCAQSSSIGSYKSTPRFQSRAEIAALPPSSSPSTIRAGFTPNSSAGRSAVQSDVYPYPANSRGARVAVQSNYVLPQRIPIAQNSSQISIGTNSTIKSLVNTSGQSSFALPTNYSVQRPAITTTAYRQPIYQAPTLGIGKTSLSGVQTCYCQPNFNPAAVASRTTAGYQTAQNSSIGSGLDIPTLDIRVPGQQDVNPFPATGQAVSQSNYQYPLPTAPQNSAQSGSWWTPFVTGSGTYPAVIRRQNMPVGSYLGQGLIGQPTAYVDGQPVRNLLRYITP